MSIKNYMVYRMLAHEKPWCKTAIPAFQHLSVVISNKKEDKRIVWRAESMQCMFKKTSSKNGQEQRTCRRHEPMVVDELDHLLVPDHAYESIRCILARRSVDLVHLCLVRRALDFTVDLANFSSALLVARSFFV